jgi:long-chain acyl-CoA synthetase
MTPIDALYRQAKDHPNSVAFVSGNDTWSYRRLAAEVDGMARALLARSLRQGIAYLRMPRIGAIATPMDLRFKTAELRHVFQRKQCTKSCAFSQENTPKYDPTGNKACCLG